MSKTIEFTGEYHVRVGEWDFHCEFPQRRRPEGHLPIAKPRSSVEQYVAVCAAEQPKVIFELGIRGGGSTALLNELAEPSKLIAIEINPRPVKMLDDYIARAGVADRVRACYGVDQSDRSRLAEIVAVELGGRPIDLVIDDASHRLVETRSSFESLFPHVRPGGLFIIEDWTCDHELADAIVAAVERDESGRLEAAMIRQAEDAEERGVIRPRPLSDLAVELVLARAASGQAVAELVIGAEWTVVRRGPSPIDPATFRLRDLYHDHFGQLNVPQ
jgi:predicted O-methyltransferase YrrM